jgi:type II secretory pathway pseudopilin PulG
MKKKIFNQVGSTLLEATLALSLLSIGLTGGLFLMQNATRASVNSDFSVAASEYANEKLEMIIADKALNVGYDGIVDGYYTPESNLSFGDSENFFTRTVIVTPVDTNFEASATDQGLKKIDVTVTWSPVGNGSANTLTVSTLLTDY